MTKRIHLISCPRNLSTALMYSFAQRRDTTVVDEPMYANYLQRTDIDHPGKEEIIASQFTDLTRVKDEIIFGEYSSDILFIKNMAQHFYDIDEQFIAKLDNIIYIRNPHQIIASFARVIKDPGVRDVGIQKQFELFSYLESQNNTPVILDSGELLKNPGSVLEKLCGRLGIGFTDKMLSWPAGPRPEDGVWAKYWYGNVHKSTSFSQQKSSSQPLPAELVPLYEQSIEYYNRLFNLAIKA